MKTEKAIASKTLTTTTSKEPVLYREILQIGPGSGTQVPGTRLTQSHSQEKGTYGV